MCYSEKSVYGSSLGAIVSKQVATAPFSTTQLYNRKNHDGVFIAALLRSNRKHASVISRSCILTLVSDMTLVSVVFRRYCPVLESVEMQPLENEA
jgi:hypothetical protein